MPLTPCWQPLRWCPGPQYLTTTLQPGAGPWPAAGWPHAALAFFLPSQLPVGFVTDPGSSHGHWGSWPVLQLGQCHGDVYPQPVYWHLGCGPGCQGWRHEVCCWNARGPLFCTFVNLCLMGRPCRSSACTCGSVELGWCMSALETALGLALHPSYNAGPYSLIFLMAMCPRIMPHESNTIITMFTPGIPMCGPV